MSPSLARKLSAYPVARAVRYLTRPELTAALASTHQRCRASLETPDRPAAFATLCAIVRELGHRSWRSSAPRLAR